MQSKTEKNLKDVILGPSEFSFSQKFQNKIFKAIIWGRFA